MTLQKLSLINFRSYAKQSFLLNSGTTIVTGKNGSGKTNFLEAIYSLANVRSFRAKDSDLVTHGQTGFSISGELSGSRCRLVYDKAAKLKKIFHNQTAVSLRHHIGSLPVVLFEPSHVSIVYGGPEERRRYLDEVLATVDPIYLETLIKYRRVLKQRNNLLRDPNSAVLKQMFVWDFKLAEYASYLIKKRFELLTYIQKRIERGYQSIAGSNVPLAISYSYSAHPKDYSAWLLENLEANLARDRRFGYTSIGPHREDMAVTFKHQQIAKIASRGEVRSFVLAIKYLELAFKKQVTKKLPILLLDDVFSELDAKRKLFVLQKLARYQTIITTTEVGADLRKLLPIGHATIHIEARHEKSAS